MKIFTVRIAGDSFVKFKDITITVNAEGEFSSYDIVLY